MRRRGRPQSCKDENPIHAAVFADCLFFLPGLPPFFGAALFAFALGLFASPAHLPPAAAIKDFALRGRIRLTHYLTFY